MDCHIWDCHSTGNDAPGGGISIVSGGGHVISGNHIHDCSTERSGGGALLSTTGRVRFTDNSVHDNSAQIIGGGFYWYNAQDNLVFERNTISGNTASRAGGSSINGAYFEDSFMVNNNIIAGNVAQDAAGGLSVRGFSGRVYGNTIVGNRARASNVGGLHLDSLKRAIVLDNTITDNSAHDGGGVYIGHTDHLTFDGNIVMGNTSPSGTGAGILHTGGDFASYTGNVISFNSTQSGNAGGLFLDAPGAILTRNEIVGNYASAVAGGLYLNAAPGIVLIENLISGNTAGRDGGGVFVNAPGASLAGDSVNKAYNVLTDNEAGRGSAVFNQVAFQPDGGGDLSVESVCWGTASTEEVQAMIYDFNDDPSKGVILVDPLSLSCLDPCTGDLDGDSDLDLNDYRQFVPCLSGPDLSTPPSCEGADLDGDADVDLKDFATLQAGFGCS